MSDQRLTDEDLSDIERMWGGHQTYVRDLLAELRQTRAERDSALDDLLQYSHLHWENCPMDAEDCYLCEGYERIRATARDRKAAHG